MLGVTEGYVVQMRMHRVHGYEVREGDYVLMKGEWRRIGLAYTPRVGPRTHRTVIALDGRNRRFRTEAMVRVYRAPGE